MKIRSKKLIDRRLQTRMTGWFLGGVMLTVGLQFLLTVNVMTDVSLEAHASPADAYEAVTGGAVTIMLKTLFISLPFMALIGILSSFKICGPLYRMKSFMREVSAGGQPADIRLRKGDELKDFAALLNETTRPLRETEDSASDSSSSKAA